MPAAYWVGDFSSDARDARNWYPYNVLPTPGDDLYFYGAAASGNFDEDIDGDGNTDSRVPGGDCLGLAGDWATVEVVLGYAGTITLGANPSSWSVGTPAPTPPTPTPFTGSGVTFQQLMLDAPGANIAQSHPLTGEVSPLTITGDIPWWANPLPASLTWYGGALNDTAVASTVTVADTTALLAPTGYGTVTTGSTLIFDAATVTIAAGTFVFANGLGMVVQNNAAVNQPLIYGAATSFTTPNGVDPNNGMQIQLAEGSQYRIYGNNNFTQIGVASTRLPLVNDSGTFLIEQGANVTIQGIYRSANQPTLHFGSLYQRSGNTVLQNGSSLTAQNGVQIYGGTLYTVANPVLQVAAQQFFTITGNLRVDGVAGAEPVVAINSGSTPHIRGELRIDGDVRWTSGTYRPFVDIADATRADLWRASGAFVVGAGVVVAPDVSNLPPDGSIAASFRARVLYAGAGFQPLPNVQQVPLPQLSLPNGVNLAWYVIPAGATEPPASKTWALGPAT